MLLIERPALYQSEFHQRSFKVLLASIAKLALSSCQTLSHTQKYADSAKGLNRISTVASDNAEIAPFAKQHRHTLRCGVVLAHVDEL